MGKKNKKGVVLVIDGYETLSKKDSWICNLKKKATDDLGSIYGQYVDRWF